MTEPFLHIQPFWWWWWQFQKGLYQWQQWDGKKRVMTTNKMMIMMTMKKMIIR